MRHLNIKGNIEMIHNNLHSIDESQPISDQSLEDVFQIAYPGMVIDAGGYSDGSLTIMVILAANDTIGPDDWHRPYCVIRCFDYDDFYVQLQRALDVYPGLVKERVL